MQYLPFGETFIDQSIDWKPRFTFTDKEKDKNTGYQYFGARYYDSEVSVWLSVDPLSDERQGLSPFNYSSLNPIMRIDPDGMLDTDYGVTKGGIIKRIGKINNEPDRLYAINDDGSKKSEKHIVINDKNLLPSLEKADPSQKEGDYWGGRVRKYSYNSKTKKEKIHYDYKKYLQLYYGTTNSTSDAKKVFRFAAKNSIVEWGLEKNKQGCWIVGTLRAESQAPTFNSVPGDFTRKNTLFRAHSHGGSNPDYDFVPSGNDLNNARRLKETNPASQSWLYTPQNPNRIWIDLNKWEE